MSFRKIYKEVLKESIKEFKLEKAAENFLLQKRIGEVIFKEDASLKGSILGGAIGGLAGLYGAGKLGHSLAKSFFDGRIKTLERRIEKAKEKGDLEKVEEMEIELEEMRKASRTPKILATIGSLLMLGTPLAALGAIGGGYVGSSVGKGVSAVGNKISDLISSSKSSNVNQDIVSGSSQ